MNLINSSKIYFLIIFCLIINLSNSYSQTSGVSPYQISWSLDASIIGTGLISGITAYSISINVSPLTLDEIKYLNKENINSFDRAAADNYSENIAYLTDGMAVVSVISPIILFLDKDIKSDFTKIFIMGSENFLWSAFLPYYGKGLAQRTRPYAYNSSVPTDKKLDADAKKSFFSTHTCLAFSSAVFLSKVYSDYFPESEYTAYIWGGSLLFAGAVGYLRVAAGEHYLSDVITGAAVGSIIGYAIPVIHKKGAKNDGLSFQVGQNYFTIAYRF